MSAAPRSSSTPHSRAISVPGALALLSVVTAVALAGQARVASAATTTVTMTPPPPTGQGFTCDGKPCAAVTVSVGDTVVYKNTTTVALTLTIAGVAQSQTTVAPGGTWPYQANTPLHDALVTATGGVLPITQLLTVNPLSTATTSSTSTPTPTPTPSPGSSTYSSSATGPPSTVASTRTAASGSGSTSGSPAGIPGGIVGTETGSSSGLVPSGPGRGGALVAGGVDSLGGGSSAAPLWWVLALLCAIASGAAFAAWLRRTRRGQFATASAGSAPTAPGPLDSGGPSDDDDLPVSYRGT